MNKASLVYTKLKFASVVTGAYIGVACLCLSAGLCVRVGQHLLHGKVMRGSDVNW